jgi:hypothetical protein
VEPCNVFIERLLPLSLDHGPQEDAAVEDLEETQDTPRHYRLYSEEEIMDEDVMGI